MPPAVQFEYKTPRHTHGAFDSCDARAKYLIDIPEREACEEESYSKMLGVTL
jgi:hypothetical protein